jgi:hypothetical protein
MKKLEMDRLPFIDSVAPKLRPQKIDESYKDYRDYLIIEVRDALLGANVEVPYQIEFNTSPLWQLKLLLEEDINVESITNIEMFIQTMKTIRLGMGQMKDIDDRINFHKCWILYYNGLSISEIYKQTLTPIGKPNIWLGTENTVIRKIKMWAVKYNWKRKNAK